VAGRPSLRTNIDRIPKLVVELETLRQQLKQQGEDIRYLRDWTVGKASLDAAVLPRLAT
jgi:hypothetical protein